MPAGDNIMISIIIPTYNSSLTLRRCLESIVSQHYTNYEVWFIDGKSSDDTLNILAENKLKYPHINYLSEPDKGIYDAMNKGIDLAKGNWLYFLGSDDTLYDKDTLAAVVNKLSGCDARVVYGNVIMRGQNQWNLDNVIFDGEYTIEKFIDRNICHQAIFYHKDVFKKNGRFNLKYITAADFDFNLRCYANTTFNYIDLIIANFFVGGHSTQVPDTEFHKDRGMLFMKYFGSRIYTKAFINARLYLQRAALSMNSPLNFINRVYCLTAYIKLKLLAVFLAPD